MDSGKGGSMTDQRGLTINFMDGSKVSFSFPEQGMNAAAKQIRIEEFLKNPFLIVLADGTLTMFPVANIKSIQMPISETEGTEIRFPAHVIRNATQSR
jgi:predicted methyltransferase MtxX (methanogen marker protein 4)